jgi:hypothetical protein
MSKQRDLVPIFYAGGCGGYLIATLLTAAKIGQPVDLNYISERGDLHLYPLDIVIPNANGPAAMSDIVRLLEWPLHPAPHYLPIHLDRNPDLLRTEFKKAVLITYDLSDVDQLSRVRQMKIPSQQTAPTTHGDNARFLIKYQNLFAPRNWTFNISWKTIISGDLIEDLAFFSGIAPQRFDRELLNRWREKTVKGSLLLKMTQLAHSTRPLAAS